MIKKNYGKPIISFQSLAIGTGISTGCGLSPTFGDGICPIEIEGWDGETVFTEMCTYYPPDIGDDSPCYHVPTANYNVFDS